jgi:hypothetical protein
MSTRIRVTNTRSIDNDNGTTTLYALGFTGTVPDHHADRLIAASAAIVVETPEAGRTRRRGGAA